MNSDFPSPQVPRIPGLRDSVPGAAYKKGDVIGGKYEVYGVLGRGGFGIVYLVYSRETGGVYALKTFRDELLSDAQTRDRFHKEASVWVDLERHPYLVRANVVYEIAGRLFIAMEYIAPDEHGLNTLEGYLRQRPPDLAQSLRWGIQFCHGMEHAYSRGIRCHRDIKPANIMIGSDKAVRITDFGLAGVLGPTQAMAGVRLSIQKGVVGLSGQTMEGTGFGTPTHMPPEQFTDAASCDERSDIYSFGVVLFQMVSSGRLPFLAPLPTEVAASEMTRFWREMHRLHATAPVPRLDSPLFPMIRRCMEKDPGKRYQSFKELREDLEPLLRRQTGEVVRIPELLTLNAWEWHNKGNNLAILGRHEEAVRCYDRALELEVHNAGTWSDKGVSLRRLGRLEEAIDCHEEALEQDAHDVGAWVNKSACLIDLGRREEADSCYNKALKLDPRNAGAWSDRGGNLSNLGRHEEAIRCHDRALELDQQDAGAWVNRGRCLGYLGRSEEAIHCYDKAIELAPLLAAAWSNKGYALVSLGRHEEAVHCYDKALELGPREVGAWNNKAAPSIAWAGTMRRSAASTRPWNSTRSTRCPGSTRD
jgi:serine/threonine protein kinase/predicted TPR repeat methyltransferase